MDFLFLFSFFKLEHVQTEQQLKKRNDIEIVTKKKQPNPDYFEKQIKVPFLL